MVNEVPLIFYALNNMVVLKKILDFSRVNKLTKGIHNAIRSYEGTGSDSQLHYFPMKRRFREESGQNSFDGSDRVESF